MIAKVLDWQLCLAVAEKSRKIEKIKRNFVFFLFGRRVPAAEG